MSGFREYNNFFWMIWKATHNIKKQNRLLGYTVPAAYYHSLNHCLEGRVDTIASTINDPHTLLYRGLGWLENCKIWLA